MWQPCQGLRSWALHHPPGVTFFLCVVTLGLTWLSLAAYINMRPVRDVDFAQDWRGVLQALGAVKVCAPGGAETASPEDGADASVLVTVRASPWQLALSHSGVRIAVNGSQLGMTGPGADTPLTVTLTSYHPAVQCNGSKAECAVKYCVSLTGPPDLLPQSIRSPRCPVNSSGVPGVLESEPSASSKCYSLVYDEHLEQNLLLSQEEAALCAQRLRNAAFVILILGFAWMVLIAFCTPPFREKKTDGPL